jgi:hypothetical protein
LIDEEPLPLAMAFAVDPDNIVSAEGLAYAWVSPLVLDISIALMHTPPRFRTVDQRRCSNIAMRCEAEGDG